MKETIYYSPSTGKKILPLLLFFCYVYHVKLKKVSGADLFVHNSIINENLNSDELSAFAEYM